MPQSPILSRRGRFWLIVAVVCLFMLYVLRPILLPFVIAIVTAYFLDPVVDRLERWMSRTFAVVLVSLAFLAFVVVVLLFAVPQLVGQLVFFVKNMPDILAAVQTRLGGWVLWLSAYLPGSMFEPNKAPVDSTFDMAWEQLRTAIGEDTLNALREQLAQSAGSIAQVVFTLVRTVWSGSLALFNAMSILFVTPFIAFYLLRDWDRMVAYVDGLIPLKSKPAAREIASEIDRALSGFIRGQSMVVFLMAIYYCVCLYIVGLDFWLLAGLVAAFFSVVPLLGSIIGFVVAFALALYQFDVWQPLVLTLVIYMIGQFIEGNILTPRLVGGSVGLHPVWVMFALFAGGAIFGFVGLLIAVPLGSIVAVFVRFLVGRYQNSEYYDDFGFEASTPLSKVEDEISPALAKTTKATEVVKSKPRAKPRSNAKKKT